MYNYGFGLSGTWRGSRKQLHTKRKPRWMEASLFWVIIYSCTNAENSWICTKFGGKVHFTCGSTHREAFRIGSQIWGQLVHFNNSSLSSLVGDDFSMGSLWLGGKVWQRKTVLVFVRRFRNHRISHQRKRRHQSIPVADWWGGHQIKTTCGGRLKKLSDTIKRKNRNTIPITWKGPVGGFRGGNYIDLNPNLKPLRNPLTHNYMFWYYFGIKFETIQFSSIATFHNETGDQSTDY